MTDTEVLAATLQQVGREIASAITDSPSDRSIRFDTEHPPTLRIELAVSQVTLDRFLDALTRATVTIANAIRDGSPWAPSS